MGAYCSKCKKYKIPLMAVLANLTGEGARCESCGTNYVIVGFSKLFYLTLEGAAILVSVYVSFYFLTAIPLAVCIFLMFLARLFFAPFIARPRSKRKRIKGSDSLIHNRNQHNPNE